MENLPAETMLISQNSYMGVDETNEFISARNPTDEMRYRAPSGGSKAQWNR